MTTCPPILVAEDNPADQMLLRRAIQKAGFDLPLYFVPDGRGVVKFLSAAGRKRRPSLLLLDLKMPEMDGFEVLEWMREHPEMRPDHVVVLSSCTETGDLSRASVLGVEHYLMKPADTAEWVGTVRRLEPYWAESGREQPVPVEARELLSAA